LDWDMFLVGLEGYSKDDKRAYEG